MLIQLLMISISAYGLEKTVRVSQVRGMNFDYLVSKQGLVTLEPIYCKDCAVVSVEGEPNSKYKASCNLMDITDSNFRIEVKDCLIGKDNTLINNTFITNSRGVAFLTIGAKIMILNKVPKGNYKGKIIINVSKVKDSK